MSPEPEASAFAAVETAAAAVRARLGAPFPEAALVLGSGLGGFADALAQEAVIPYTEIPGFPASTVAGHAGRLVIGLAGTARIACMQGRLHLYEGHSPAAVALPVRTLRALGVRRIVLTNAAGGIREGMRAGDLMALTDHINYAGANPLIGPNDERFGPRFFDMSAAYDPALRARLVAAAQATGVRLHQGVYLFTLGPNFETPAEIRAFGRMGADAVGMSTVPECLVARHLGMQVAAVSVITNLAAGLSGETLSHAETLAVAAQAYGDFEKLMRTFLEAEPG